MGPPLVPFGGRGGARTEGGWGQALADQPPGREALAEYQRTLQRGDPRDEEDLRRRQERQLLERERAEMAGDGGARAEGSEGGRQFYLHHPAQEPVPRREGRASHREDQQPKRLL